MMLESGVSDWLRYPEAEAFLLSLWDEFLAQAPPVQALGEQVAVHTSTRLVDWLDHLVLADGKGLRTQLDDLGFQPEDVPVEPGDTAYHHPGALFPRLLLRSGTGVTPGRALGAAISVGDVTAFLLSQRVPAAVEGSPQGPYRRAHVWRGDGWDFHAVERRWGRGFVPAETGPDLAQAYLAAYERWATRAREFDNARQGMQQALALAQTLVNEVGADVAAWAAFRAEQVFWQQRNWAGQAQRARQDRFGLGWANRDHMAFRSSREVFHLLIEILETFGFQARERFYAGAEAGWGAQVMEHQACRFGIFADVDLAPDEIEDDFGHILLPTRDELGTIGLWCGLHGESMLAAGPHHLACRLDFDAAVADLSPFGVETMHPFSDFEYLRQAFTRGERWAVPQEQLDRLAAAGLIDDEQQARFAEKGAVGSHLENIQRGEGFKGFNQQTVSDIIRRTDPRTVAAA